MMKRLWQPRGRICAVTASSTSYLMLSLLLAILLEMPSMTNAAISTDQYRWFCDLSVNPVITLEYDPQRRNYVRPIPTRPPSSTFDNDNGFSSSTMGSATESPTSASTAYTNDDGSNQPLRDYWNKDNDRNGSRRRSRTLWESFQFYFLQEEYDNDDYSQWNFEQESEALQSSSSYLRASMPAVTYSEKPLFLNNVTQTLQRHLQEQQQSSTTTVSEQSPTVPIVVFESNDNNGFSDNSLHNQRDYPRDDEEKSGLPAATVQVRACDCWNSMVWGGDYYCTLPRTHCAIPSSPLSQPGCVDVQKQRRIVRSIWPVLIVWYASVLFCLSFTITGRHAMGCCVAAIVPGWNQRTADRLLAEDPPHQANQMLLRHYRIMRTRYERRFLRQLRRRARRDRRRQRRQEREELRNRANINENNNNAVNNNHHNDNSNNHSDSDSEDMEPFPSLWDLAIIPRQVANVSSEPVPTTLTLQTRIYKRSEHYKKTDGDDDVVAEAPVPTSIDSCNEEQNAVRHDDSTPSLKCESTSSEAITDPSEDGIKQDIADAAKNPDTVVDDPNVGYKKSSGGSKENNESESMVEAAATPLQSDEEKKPTDIEDMSDESDSDDLSQIDNGHDHSMETWDDNACAICYVPLEDGDRVGALPCGHIFHVDPCLKHWLTRRNVCPLCLTENVATPQFAEVDRPATATATNDQESTSSNVDRSTSRDGDDDDSSGIVQQDYMIPAFSGVVQVRQRNRNTTERSRQQRQSEATRQNRGRAVMAGLTNFFRRRNLSSEIHIPESPDTGAVAPASSPSNAVAIHAE